MARTPGDRLALKSAMAERQDGKRVDLSLPGRSWELRYVEGGKVSDEEWKRPENGNRE